MSTARYKYRNLPCSITTEEKLWCVSGVDKHKGSVGVLEWCSDEEDAQAVFENMKKFPQFVQLRYSRWLDQEYDSC